MHNRSYPFPLPMDLPAWQLPMLMRKIRESFAGELWKEMPYNFINMLEEAIQYRHHLHVDQKMLDSLPDPVWDRLKILFGIP